MTGVTRFAYLACLRPNVPAFRVGRKCTIRGGVALALVLFPAAASRAQCVTNGLVAATPGMAPWTGAIASGSASVASLVSSINSVNTAFLTQSSAFIGSPPNPQPDQQGGGVWTRTVGGHVDFGASTTATNINLNGPVPGGVTCNTRSREDFIGVQVGADVARLNVNGWNLHAGVTTGFLGSSAQDATPQGPNNPPGSLGNNLQVPFIGLYGAASYGGFLFDAQVRGDFYQSEVSDGDHGLYEQHFGGRGLSVSGNVAYHQNLANQWFIEPSAGLTWSRTHVDPLNLPGSLVFGTGALPPWILTVSDIGSTLGRFSVRAGTTVKSGSMVLQPFASLGVFHDFQRGVTSSLTSDFPAVGIAQSYSSTISTPGIGTYGQFGLGVAAQIVDTGWVGYLRGDYRKGDNIEGWTLNGGLRYQFVPDPTAKQQAVIAKAPVYKAPAQTPYNWTGFYVGADVGAVWGFTNWNFPDGSINPHVAGFLGGGNLGYNYQVGNWVFGIEGSIAGTTAQGARPCPTGFFYSCEASINWLSSATGRVGYAWDRNLAYVKAGAVIALGQTNFTCITGSQATTVHLVGCPEQSDSKILAGWTAGVGYEFGLTRNMSVKGEVSHFDLGSEGHDLAGIPTDLQRSGFMSTVGLRYRFGG